MFKYNLVVPRPTGYKILLQNTSCLNSVWYGTVQCGMKLYCVVWYRMVRYGKVQYGTVLYGTVR